MIKAITTIIRNFVRKIGTDFVSAFSSQAAFFIILSFFPFTMFLLTLLHYLPISESTLMMAFTRFLPSSIDTLVSAIIQDIDSRTTGTVISITVLTALWSASRGFLAIIRGLNGVYQIRETRNYFILRFIATLYTLVFSIVIIISLFILVFGNRISDYIQVRIPFLNDLAVVVMSFRTIVALCVLVLFFLCLYVAIPNRKTRIINELPGAIVTAVGWLGFSYAYSFYIDNMSNFSYMYGSLTAIVLCMLWLYFCMYIMFVGAEVNMFLQNKDMMRDIDHLKTEILAKK